MLWWLCAGTLGSYKLSHSGGFSATGDFSHAVALNPTPSQEYLHLLSPSKRAQLEKEVIFPSDLETSRDRTTRENTRHNRQVSAAGDVRKCSDSEKIKQSIEFDSETLELKLNISEVDDDNESSTHTEGQNVDSKADVQADRMNSNSQTGHYSSALAMFSPDK